MNLWEFPHFSELEAPSCNVETVMTVLPSTETTKDPTRPWEVLMLLKTVMHLISQYLWFMYEQDYLKNILYELNYHYP